MKEVKNMRKINTKREKKEKFRWMKVVDENKIKVENKNAERKENLKKKSKREKERE